MSERKLRRTGVAAVVMTVLGVSLWVSSVISVGGCGIFDMCWPSVEVYVLGAGSHDATIRIWSSGYSDAKTTGTWSNAVSFRAPKGTHSVSVSAPGSKTWQGQAHVTNGCPNAQEAVRLDVTLQPLR